jgi:putative ABC transport system ATP-binding protein
MTQIAVDAVSKTFRLGDQVVHGLDNVSLAVEAGEYVSVMGPSGSGKSTLLNLIGLLDRPDTGRYSLEGTETTGLGEEDRARLRGDVIGFVFQSYHLVPRLTARENVELPLMLAGISPRERKRRVEETLQRLGIAERGHHLPNQLSGGQRQRVAIGRAIVMQPRLLLADEPTGNLDSRSGADVVEVLEQLNREGITLLVVTHDAALGARARRRISMRDGCIVSDDTSVLVDVSARADMPAPGGVSPHAST